MVYFICQGCQETLKKPACEKHLMQKRNCWGCGFTCVDCGVCFGPDDWKAHNQCISEEKKYQGALYVEKGTTGVPKGRAKQDLWTLGLARAVEIAEENLKQYVEKLVTFDNVPRKQKAFLNFVNNSCRIGSPAVTQKVWDVIERANKELLAEQKKANGGDTKKPVSKRRWSTWENEVAEVVKEHGAEGAIEWKELQRHLGERYEDQMQKGLLKKRKKEDIPDLVLSKVPEAMLSASDSKIRVKA